MTAAQSRKQRVLPEAEPNTGGQGPQVPSVEQTSEPVKISPVPPASPRISLTANDGGKISALVEASNAAEFAAMFGSADRAFADMSLHDLVNLSGVTVAGPGPIDTTAVNGTLALVAAIEPQGELEAAIALQLAGFHRASMSCLARAANPAATREVRAQNLASANKCSRTFATLLEQLNRHRGKVTTQRVVVENVTVEAGGQAVVGAVVGAGQRRNSGGQGHGHEGSGAGDAEAGACDAALFGANAPWHILPTGGDQGAEAMPPSWLRAGQRSAEGQSQCLEARALQRSGDHDATGDAGDVAQRQGHRMKERV